MSDAKRLRALEDEIGKLKRLLADAMLDNAGLKDLGGSVAEVGRDSPRELSSLGVGHEQAHSPDRSDDELAVLERSPEAARIAGDLVRS